MSPEAHLTSVTPFNLNVRFADEPIAVTDVTVAQAHSEPSDVALVVYDPSYTDETVANPNKIEYDGQWSSQGGWVASVSDTTTLGVISVNST